MSDVWKRLANVAKGTVKTWTRDDGGRPDTAVDDDDLMVTPIASAAPPREHDPVSHDDPQARKRRVLEMALADGVISREEYDQRVEDLEGGVGTPARPKKRTL